MGDALSREPQTRPAPLIQGDCWLLVIKKKSVKVKD